MKIPAPSTALESGRWIGSGCLALWGLLSLHAAWPGSPGGGTAASLGKTLGQAGPRDPLHVRRPSVVAQLPHVLGHHVEKESDKALGADAGHWGQRRRSAPRQSEQGCSGPVSELSPGPATVYPRPLGEAVVLTGKWKAITGLGRVVALCSDQGVWETPRSPCISVLAGPWHLPLFPGVHLVPLGLHSICGVRDGIGDQALPSRPSP